jgi:HSP20 family protein
MIVTRIHPRRSWNWDQGEFDRMRREMARLQDAMTRGFSWHGNPRMFPLVNVTQDKDNLYVRAELPGVKPSDMDLSVKDNSICISGKRELPGESENVSYHRREREGGNFSRSIELPSPFDREHVEAKFENGVLSIVLPLAEETKPRQITVKAG